MKKNNVIIRERKKLCRTGIVMMPEDQTWLKQSNIITNMYTNFSYLHMRVLIGLVEQLQVTIDQKINNVPFQQLQLFQTDDHILRISIPLKSFGIQAGNYSLLKKALLELATIPVQLDTTDPRTGEPIWRLSGMFTASLKKDKYARNIDIEIHKDIAKTLINVEKGFTKYLKEITLQTQSKYTIRLYMLISSWKDKGGFSITLKKFREWLQLDKKYLLYKDLYKRIIRPTYEELFEKSDCWFEISEEYNDGEKEPYKLNFKIVRAELTFKEKQFLKTHSDAVYRMMINHLKMTDKQARDIVDLVTIYNVSPLQEKILDLGNYIKQNIHKINNIPMYCYNALFNFLEPIEGAIGEIEELKENNN